MTAQAPVLESFIKRYSDRNYKYPVLVRHQGTVIALAMDDQRRIYYSVLNLNGQDNSLDVNAWADQPQELEFPREIAEVGFGIADQRLLPTVKKGSRDPVAAGVVVADNEEDKFLSRTARLTADAPFQAMSDGRFVYVFRQAIAAGHADQITVPGPGGQAVAVVDSTLLVDRFVLSGASPAAAQAGAAAPAPRLKLNLEVRFRRSRSKTRPQSTKDSLGARDMQDQPFFEPTQELSFIRNLRDGRFSILLLPTTIAEVSRWQIFAFNGATGLIDSYNVERSLEGLFNTRGTQASSSSDAAETALDFSRESDRVTLSPGVVLGQGFSQEAWIFPRVTAPEPGTALEQALLGADDKTAAAPPSIWIVDNRRVRVGFGDGSDFHAFITGEVLRSNQWNHLAVVFSDDDDDPGYHLYVNGLPVEVREEGAAGASRGKRPVDAPISQIGSASRSFFGLVDEIRLWHRPRSEREIRSDRNLRLTGQELGLAAYWRLDEGSGAEILDQTGNHAPGTLNAGFAARAWVLSEAPIGENAGVSRDSFRFEGRTVASGMASLLYFQQEAARTGYDQQAKPVRQGARVMLAVATQTAGASGPQEPVSDQRKAIATLDFGVAANGRLAKVPDNLSLQPVAVERDGDPVDVSAELAQIQAIQQVIDQTLSADDTADVSAELAQIEALQATINDRQQAARRVDVNAELDRIQTLQGAITQKTQRITTLTEEIDYLNRVFTIVDDAIANRNIVLNVPTGSLDSLNLPTKLSRLRDLRSLQASGQQDLQQLIEFLRNARVTLYEHANFGGRSLSFGLNALSNSFSPRFVGYTQLNQANFNDLISSIGISTFSRVGRGQRLSIPALQVTVYEHANRNDNGRQRGFVHTFTEITDFVGRDINDRISSLDIAENPAFQSHREELARSINSVATDLNTLLNELRDIRTSIDAIRLDQDRQRRQLEQAVISDRTTLAALQNLLNKGFVAAMPLVHSDVSGLSIAGGLLSFAWSEDTPLLFDSAVGNVALYFRGTDDQFFVAYYKTLTQRARYTLNDALGGEAVVGFARSTEAEMDRIRLDVAGDDTAATCTVTLQLKAGDQAIVETWQQVPRAPEGFAKVLNGLAGDRTFVGRGEIVLTAGRADTLTVAGGINRSLPAGATLFIGDLKATLERAVDQGATELAIRTEAANPTVETLPVFFLEYDYAVHASTTQGGADLSSGSKLLAFIPNGSGQAVKPQTVRSGLTLSSRWVSEAPGHTYAFDGLQSHARLEAASQADLNQRLRPFSPQSDLTLEAWVRPSQIAEANQRARVIHFQPPAGTADTRYLLGLKREELNTAIALNGGTDVVRIPNAAHLNVAGAITLEAWVKPAKNENNGNVIVHGNAGGDQVYLRLNEGRYEAGCQQGGVDHRVSVVMPAADRTGSAWVHLAGVYDGTHWRLYRNGIAIGEQADGVGAIQVNGDWGLGSHPTISNRILTGAIAEARIWKRGRTQADIAADMNREVVGNETDLVGCWRFDNFGIQRATDHSRFGAHGTLVGNPQATASPLPAYSVFAGVGEQLVQAAQKIPAGNWNHLAAVFNQSYGVQLDGQPATFLDAGTDLTLDLNRDLTLEVAFKVNDLSQARALLTKGKISATEDPEQHVPYALYLNPAGRLVFAFEDVKGKKHLFISQPIPNPTAFHTVTISRKRNTITNPVRNNDGQQTGVDIVSWDAIQFFVDGQANTPSGQPYGVFEYKKAGSNTTGTPRQEDGRNASSPSPGFNAGQPQQPLDIGNSSDPLEFGSGFNLASFDPSGDELDSINGVYISAQALFISNNGGLTNPQQAEMLALAANVNATAQQLVRDTNLLTQVQRLFDTGLSVAPLNGVLAEIRLWNVPLEAGSLKPTLQGGEKGLLSWWRFEEAEGTLAFDAKGGSHARLKGAVQWVKDPNPSGSQLVLYRNGQLLSTDLVPTGNRAALLSPQAQFTLGGLRRDNKTQEFFQGEMEEVRIWQTARTVEQIQDNLFRRLLGENGQFLDNREDLLAYYPFDTQQAGVLSDYSLLGNDLTPLATEFVLSTAPIGEDTPQVRSALAGVRTPFSDRLQSAPAVQEYGDLQTDADGNLFGIYKRCYGLIKDGQWELITGFKVGELVTEWVGQVQFDPQLIGFIEGAPPVPGENLTSRGAVLGEFANYNGASSVELKQASKTDFTFSAEKESGFDSSFDLTLGLLTKASASAGIGLELTVADASGAFGIKAKFENSLGWLSSGSTSLGLTTNLSSKQQLQGFVEPSDAVAFGDVGRRFIPENMGFALVQSQTADVFALRLKHNSALVSYQMRPNPDIPPDHNIINFPLNPAYTKQGTLDGKIGFTPDPAYPNALTYSNDSSFYKPVEAFALKQRIQREEERVRAYYDQYDAGAVGRRQNVLFGQTGDLGSEDVLQNLPRLEKRNLANTYVWTADGGLFAETQETMDVVQESYGGSYAFKGVAGVFADLDVAISGVGVKFGFEALFGGRLNVQATKSIQSENAFSVEVNVDEVERDVFLRDAAGNVLFDRSNPLIPKALRHPGKVDAYRFMTFYLEPQADHFDLFFNQVVDPIWLEQSTDANALALRSLRDANQGPGTKPPCWRIFHRVTFVSRVLPPIGSTKPLPALESQMRELSIDSNFELIKRLDPFVADKVDDFGEFSRAVRDTIATFLPELQPHVATITEFMRLFYGITEPTSLADSAELTALLAGERAPNAPPVVWVGRSQTLRLEDGAVQTTLPGSVADDRLSPDAIFVTWAVQSAPAGAAVTVEDPHSPVTTASFSAIGRYQLSLTASDGTLSTTEELDILVNQSPLVRAGEDQDIGFRQPLELRGELVRDGRGERATQTLTTRWEAISGPGRVTFDNAAALRTQASFSTSGVYLLRLTAETTTASGVLSHSDDLQVFVGARINRGLLSLYSFAGSLDNGSTTVRDVAGVGVPTDLAIVGNPEPLTLTAGATPFALALKEPARLTSANPSRLIAAIKASGEFTLEAWINPSQGNQPGLGRILTLSGGASARNLILGQAGNQFHVGVRTSETNGNASDRAFAGGTITPGRLTHVVCTRQSGGPTRLYIDGQEVAQRTIGGSLANWDESFALALGSELGPELRRDRAWLGDFHLVALYSSALTPAEIATNFEVGADANLAPVVEAGADQVINLPGTLSLKGAVVDDQLLNSRLSVLWSQPGGLSPVAFSTPNGLETAVNFVAPGTSEDGRPFKVSGVYTLRLTVDDGAQSISDEVKITVNHAPIIEAPKTLVVQLPNRAQLTAEVQSGLGDARQGRLTLDWSQLSGPGTVSFSDATLANPTAQFSESGTYVLRLTASNGLLTSVADVTVHANKAPTIRITADPLVNLPAVATLQGEVVDTGLADPAGTVSAQWSVVSGPDPGPTFADARSLATTASFSTSGEYTLRLTVSTGELSTSREVVITANQAPMVEAGPDQSLDLPALAELDGTVSDDGFPTRPGRMALAWSKVSGPGTVTFADPASDITTAQFSQGGTYVLRLTANDGAIASHDDLTIQVNQPPVVNAGADQVLTLGRQPDGSAQPAIATLSGTVQDDGLPTNTLRLSWQQVSGPAPAVLADATTAATLAEFPQAGTYVLELSASDGRLTGRDTVTVVVSQRVMTGLQALYDFREGTGNTIRDRSGLQPALDLALVQGAIARLPQGRGITLQQPSLLATSGAATRLSQSLQRSQAMTVEAWVKPAQATYSQLPARIVTLSVDTSNRNLTLGQGDNQYVARLRTTTTGGNGTNRVVEGGSVSVNQLTHLVYTRDGEGNATLYINGQGQKQDRIDGALTNWNATYRLALGNEFTGDRPWLGEYHLVAIYDRALSAEEVAQNFATRLP